MCTKKHTLAIIGGAIDKKIFISLALANRVKIHNKAYGPQHKSTNRNWIPQNFARQLTWCNSVVVKLDFSTSNFFNVWRLLKYKDMLQNQKMNYMNVFKVSLFYVITM